MATKQKGFRLPAWVSTAVKELSDKTEATETEIVVEFLTEKLIELGYQSPLNKLRSDVKQEKKADVTGTPARSSKTA